MTQKNTPAVAARLTLIVEFDEVPEMSAVERILDEARGYGGIKSALFETLQLVKKELR